MMSLFKGLVSIFHGIVHQREFSRNKYLIQLHSTSVEPDTIETLFFVKDATFGI